MPTEADLEAGKEEQANENLGQHVSKDGQNGEFGQNEPKESVSATERRYPDRVRKPPGHLDDFQLSESDEEEDDVITTVLANVKVDYCYKTTAVPNSYEEAMASEESSEWNKKIYEEFQKIEEAKTWEIVSRDELQGRKTVKSRLVFTSKVGPTGEEQKKVRVVAKGYSQ